MKFTKVISWMAVVAWMVVIFLLSHQPADASSQLSSGITAYVLKVINTIIPSLHLELAKFGFFIRKAAHFTAYFLLGILLLQAFRRSEIDGIIGFLLAFGIAVLYAISDEVHQLFVVGRSGEVRDVLIDSAGAMTGIVVYLLVIMWWQRRKNKQTRHQSF